MSIFKDIIYLSMICLISTVYCIIQWFNVSNVLCDDGTAICSIASNVYFYECIIFDAVVHHIDCCCKYFLFSFLVQSINERTSLVSCQTVEWQSSSNEIFLSINLILPRWSLYIFFINSFFSLFSISRTINF